MAYIPFKERLWCSVDETCLVTGEGRTVIFAKISAGEIVSKLQGRRRLVHVPSLIAKYDVKDSRAQEEKEAGAQESGNDALQPQETPVSEQALHDAKNPRIKLKLAALRHSNARR